MVLFVVAEQWRVEFVEGFSEEFGKQKTWEINEVCVGCLSVEGVESVINVLDVFGVGVVLEGVLELELFKYNFNSTSC